jgi:hypothetical protein
VRICGVCIDDSGVVRFEVLRAWQGHVLGKIVRNVGGSFDSSGSS